MKKKHTFKLPPSVLPHRQRDMEKLVQNPEAMKAILEMNNAAANVLEQQRTMKALTIKDWLARSFAILPEKFQNDDELKASITACFSSLTDEDTENETHS